MPAAADDAGAPAGVGIRPGPLLAAAAAAVATIGACAREMPPPGTLPDDAVPRIISIRPGPDSIAPGFDGQLRLRFDEPVSVPQDLPRRMFVSPMEQYRMETGFSDLRLEPIGGWRDSTVYCYEIPDGITDLLRNRMEDTTSFCFSTGVPIASTRAVGRVVEAISGRAPQEALVLFRTETDSTPYGARSGSDGTFTARAIPPGRYRAYGFVDQNRNLTLDATLEPYDSADVVLRPDSVVRLAFSLVPPDTTPPVLVRATPIDRYTIELEFDDPLRNPQASPPDVEVRDSRGAPVPILGRGMGRMAEAELPLPDTASAPDSLAAPIDSLGAAADSLAAPVDSAGAAARPAGLGGAPQDSAPPILPTRFVAIRFEAALAPATYSVSASGLVNLRFLAGGGDTTFVVEPPPEPDPAALDSAAADTLGVSAAPDTLGGIPAAPEDTLPPPDTLGVRARGGGHR